MRVFVDDSRCQGHTLCVMNAPAVFGSSDEDGHAVVLTEDVDESQRAAVELAVGCCPENAITLHD